MDKIRTAGTIMMIGQEKLEKAFFSLLRAGLWEREPDELSIFPLTRDEWWNVFVMTRKQTVTALVYQGICMMPEALFPPQDILLKWVAAVDAIEKFNGKMNKCLHELYCTFAMNGLNPVLQKGQGVATFYENPLSRECGDIDLYFTSKDDLRKAVEIVNRLECKVNEMPDGSYNFRFRNVEVEIHKFLVDICNPFKRKRIRNLEKSFGYTKVCLNGCGTEISVPSPFINLLLVNTHILKHSLGWGIGLRQLCDMARACYSLNDCYSKVEMKKYCDELGITKWTRLLNAFMVDYLGLDEKFLIFKEREKSSAILKDIIMKGGNFGMDHCRRKSEGKSKMMAKFDTMLSFFSNMGFMLRYAPVEGFWTFAGLVKGQL